MKKFLSEQAISLNSLIKLSDCLPYPFIIAEKADGETKHIYFNNVFVAEIGYTCEELPNEAAWFEKAYRNPAYRKEVMDNWQQLEKEAARIGNSFIMSRSRVTCKSNEQRWYLIKASVIDNVHIVAFVDLNNELSLQESLIQTGHNKDRLLSILSHDLRGPITNLFTISSLATTGDLTSDEFTCMAQLIQKQSFQVLELLDTTLNWARSNYSGFKMEKTTIDLEQLVNRIFAIYRNVCESKQLKTSIKFGALRNIEADAEIMTVVLRNLISNAIKFTPPKGLVEIGTAKNEIIIRDSGIGMSKNMISDIFNKTSASRKGTNDELGLGMGLNLVLDLVKLVPCDLEIESKPSEGTVMKLKFNG